MSRINPIELFRKKPQEHPADTLPTQTEAAPLKPEVAQEKEQAVQDLTASTRAQLHAVMPEVPEITAIDSTETLAA